MVYRKNTSSRKDIYQEITNRIIEEMEKGQLPWQKAWNGKVGAFLISSPWNSLKLQMMRSKLLAI